MYRFQLEDSIEEAMCTNDPWLILHKIESPTKMRFVGNKANSCPDELFSSDASVPSLAPYMQHPGGLVVACNGASPWHLCELPGCPFPSLAPYMKHPVGLLGGGASQPLPRE